MSDLELKIKRITLAAEVRGIKVNEQRLKRKIRRLDAQTKEAGSPSERNHALAKIADGANAQRADLRSHRINEVRHEARAMHLACNFLRGRAYLAVEPISYMWRCSYTFDAQWDKLWDRVRYHVERHLPARAKNTGLDEFGKWEEDAKRYASTPDMHQPALAEARAGSLKAKAERRKFRDDVLKEFS